MFIYVSVCIYIDRERECVCVCKLAAKPRGRQVFPDFMETSHRKVKRFGQFTMKGQQSEWLKNVASTCSLMQFAHKWIQMMQLIYCSNDLGLSKNRVSQNYPKSVRFATGITPPYLDKPKAQVWRFFVEPRPRYLKRENSQALQSFTLEYTLTLGLPLAPDFFFVVMWQLT